MNPDPDYSAAYLVVETEAGPSGHAFVFTIGRGNDVQVAAVRSLESHLLGVDVEVLVADMGAASRRLVNDSQLRWLGPEKGVLHMAIGAVVNALWDIKAKLAGLPLWRLLAQMSPEELVDLIDFRYLTDALTPTRALEILTDAESGRATRTAELLRDGYPAYTTTPGWLGYSDERLDRLARQAVLDGFDQIKLKVGADLEDDKRRLAVARAAVGPDVRIAIDANQRWDVGPAIEWMEQLAPYRPHWIEEPTSPDDILGHAAIRRAISTPVATGEQVHNRVMFKQLLQAGAIDYLQIDAVRVAGVNENVAILFAGQGLRRPGLPPCRRGRTLRSGPAPVHVRFRRGQRDAGEPGHRVRGSSPRALPGSGGDQAGPVSGAGACGEFGRNVHRLARRPTSTRRGRCGHERAISGTHRAGHRRCLRHRAGHGGGVAGSGRPGGRSGPRAGRPPGFTYVESDITENLSVVGGIEELLTEFGGLDILVNNAGIGARGGIETNPDDEWRRVFEVNVLGAVRVTRAVLPALRRSGHAAIVNTCSIAATAGLPQRALYSASKGALLSLTLAMAADLIADGIRVNAVNPGTADTPWVARLLEAAQDPEAEREALAARQPLGRLVTAEEVAAAIVFLASPASGSTTGTSLAVDGGLAGLRVRRP